ncbi:hypothetical protein QJS10_CPB11g01204 [Acorus calamus]|uniref:PGG domain-containing protein n=1 Tax=Acorus calamus TaxID=4465 RepID=A0AAV9DSW3_ACOCL|nr:hypothetical protein QJS10_CPB11g01204 [Acorus calamus]
MSQSTNQRIRNRKLFEAAQQGKKSDFTDITSEDQVFDATDPAGNTVLHVASMTGQEDVAKMLCTKRPSLIVTKNKAGNTPLHYALKTERYINITALRKERDDSLFMELMKVLKEKVPYDPEHGGAMGLEANEAGESLLFLAADRGLLESVKRLIEFRVELDFKGPNGWTALHAAVFRRNREIAEELLKCKPELNNKGDDSGNTPLHYAVANHDSKMMELLLKSDDAAPDDGQSIAYHGNDDGHTPLHVAASCGYKSMVKAIVHRHPGCVTLTDKKGRTVLHLAVQLDHLVVVKHILKHPEFAGLINDRDCDGNTALHLAALLDNHFMVLMLSTMDRHKMDPSPLNKAGRTPRDILDPGDLKSTLARFAGINNPLRFLFIEAGGHHGPRLCDLSKKLNSERLATAKANGSNGQSEADNDDGGKEGKASMLEKLASNLLLVATLIITVTFAAIITMPGGFENDQNNTTTNTTNNGYGGTALLARRRAFQAFVLTDMLAFLLAFRAPLRLIWTALMMGVESLVDDIRFAQWMVQTALVAMTLEFGTGAYSVLARHCNWIAEVVLGVVCFYTLPPFMELLPSLLGKSQEALRALGLAYQTGRKRCAKMFSKRA